MTVVVMLLVALFVGYVWRALSRPGGLARLGRAVLRMGEGMAVVYSPMAAAALFSAAEESARIAPDGWDRAEDAEADLAAQRLAGTLSAKDYHHRMAALAAEDAVRHPLRLPLSSDG